jgi:hypothetical protein
MERAICEVGDPKFLELVVWWRAARGARPWPTRRDFDPLLFPRLLADLFLCDVVSGGPQPRFVYRLTGTAIDRALGANGRGREVTELPIRDDEASDWPQFADTVRLGRPTCRDGSFVADERVMGFRRLLLPLGPEERVEQLLGAMVLRTVREREPAEAHL